MTEIDSTMGESDPLFTKDRRMTPKDFANIIKSSNLLKGGKLSLYFGLSTTLHLRQRKSRCSGLDLVYKEGKGDALLFLSTFHHRYFEGLSLYT